MASRIDNVRTNLAGLGLEQALICDPMSIRYLTGYYTFPHERFFALLVSPRGSTLFANRLFPNAEGYADRVVTFSDTVTSISESAFSGCASLSSVNFGRSLSSIGEKAFSGCTALERFDVASSNATFSSSDGVLFSDGGKTLSFYPCGKKDAVYTVPAGTTDIAENAFSGALFLEKAILSDDTVNLGSEAFTDCIALFEIEFGGITKISKKANPRLFL